MPEARMRIYCRGRRGIVYDPQSKEKAMIRAYVQNRHKRGLINHPRVSFIFHMPIPKSTPKKLLPLYESGLLKHEKKPDTDNLIKPYMDAMTGIAYEGDQKVQLGPCVKLYHPDPKTIIIINETSQILSPLEVDPMTWYALNGIESGKQTYAEMDSLSDFYTPDTLEFGRSFGMTYPRQNIDTSEPVPLAQWGLAKLNLSAIQLPSSLGS